jgi:pyridoxal phosphate enzyme (YggS family)
LVALPDPESVAALAAARSRVLATVAEACARTGRDPADVQLVAVSKTVAAYRLVVAVAAGLSVLGENRVQEAESKIGLVAGARWHLIGPLQSNKVRRAIELFETVETIESLELARRLDRLVGEKAAGSAQGRPNGEEPTPTYLAQPLDVYLEVNVDRDPAKAGFSPEALEAALPELADLPNVKLRGLMTVGRLAANPAVARPTFSRLRELSGRLRSVTPSLGAGLSMGMSDDYGVAVEEGATVIRVGRALFGERRA